MVHDIFISYATEDKKIADEICEAIEKNNFNCWIAPRDIVAGISYARSIINAINNCKIVVFIFTSYSNNSEQVKRELEHAVDTKKSIIPIRVENIKLDDEIKFYIKKIHWLDALKPPLAKYIPALIHSIKINLSYIINSENQWDINKEAVKLAKLGKFDEADRLYNSILTKYPNFSTALYNKACLEARKNNAETSIQYLEKAINLDMKYRELAKEDDAFKNIRKDEEFKRLIKGKLLNIFLSYSTIDIGYFKISEIANRLENYPNINKVSFWEADSGQDIVAYMERALELCDIFILFSSENSKKSKSVELEWQAAFQLRKRGLMKIIPVYKNEKHIPYLLTPLLNVKFEKKNFKQFIETLYHAILR